MGVLFDELDDYYAIADAAELTLQDGDWCVGGWTKIDDNAGTFYQYLASNNTYGVNNSLIIYLRESSEASNPDEWGVNVQDGDGTAFYLDGASSPGADSKWRLVIVQRNTAADELQMWLCESGQSATKDASLADTNMDAINGGDWNVGRRTDGNADRYYGSIACEFFKGDFALTQSEIEKLATGHTILSLGKSPDVYQPMWTPDDVTDYSGNGNDMTKYSSPQLADHAPVMTPAKRRIV